MLVSHLGRPTEGEPSDEFSIAARCGPPGGAARARSAAGQGLDRRRRRRPGQTWSCSKTCVFWPARKSATRRWRRRWRRCATCSSWTPSVPRIVRRPVPMASPNTRRLPAPVRSWLANSMRSRQRARQSGPADRRDRRWLKSVHQAHGARCTGGYRRSPDRRRRNCQHVHRGGRSRRWQVTVRKGHARHCANWPGGGNDRADIPVPGDVVVGSEFRQTLLR